MPIRSADLAKVLAKAGRLILPTCFLTRYSVMFGRSQVFRVGLLILMGLMSCSTGPGSIRAKDYPRDCATAADCFAVFEGVVSCCGGGCPNTAIRRDSVARYRTAFEAVRTASCQGFQPPCSAGPMCIAIEGTCDNGMCGVASPPADAAPHE